MPPQSPGRAVVSAPSPLLSPPMPSSLSEVNVTGAWDVPDVISEPDTDRPHAQPRPTLTTVPAATRMVAPSATASGPLITIGRPARGSDRSFFSLPERPSASIL